MVDKTKLQVAHICFDNPFLRPAEGGKRGIMSRIESLLSDDSYDVDIYLMNKPSEGFATNYGIYDQKARLIRQYQMNHGISILYGIYPICVNKRFIKSCAHDLENRNYDVAIYEGEQVAKYRLQKTVSARYHIIYMHDIESMYRTEIAKSQKNLIMKIANCFEAVKFRRLESLIDKYFDRVWFVSNDECKVFSKKYLELHKGVYMPFPATTISKHIVQSYNSKKLLYVGDLSVKHNYLSIKWFVEEVFRKIKARLPQAEIQIIGRIGKDDAEQLTKAGATVCGYVNDLNTAYEEAACFVCPVLYGAGVKVKTIDALSYGQIVITNSKGVEGTNLQNGRHLLVIDDANEMAQTCIDILINRQNYLQIASAGLDFIRSEHSIEHQTKQIKQEIKITLK